jgi:hypothetical protein
MNDGVKMVLERMKTHPEEFYGEESRWSYVMSRYEKFFTQEEKNHLENAITNLRRGEFTARVMEKLLEEPVKLDKETYTFQTTGRDPWGSSTLQLHQKAHSDYLDAYKQELSKQIREEQLKLAAEAFKKEIKNKSPFEKIKGKKYP